MRKLHDFIKQLENNKNNIYILFEIACFLF